MAHTYRRHVTRVNVTCIISGNESCHTRDWGNAHMWTHHATHSHERSMSHIWRICVTRMNEWLVVLCVYRYESLESLIHACDTYLEIFTHLCVTRMNEWLIPTSLRESHGHMQRLSWWVMSHVWIRHVTHMNKSHHTHAWAQSHTWMSHMGWLRLVGSS